MSLLPTQLISSIVDLSNRSNEKPAVVVSINPETGKQSIDPNPVRMDLLKGTVKDCATLLKKHRRLFTLHEQINEKIDTEEDLDVDDFIDDPDYFKEAIAEFAKADTDIDADVIQCAYNYYGVDGADFCDGDPITSKFYANAFEIANMLSALSPETRVRYLAKVIETIHLENPELDLSMHTFIRFYVRTTHLFEQVDTNLAADARPEDLAQYNTNLLYYEPIIAFDREDSLCIFKWANRNEEDRRSWLAKVSGSK